MYPLTVGLVIGTKKLADQARAGLEGLSVRVVLEQPDIRDLNSFLTRLEQARPDVLFIEAALLADSMEAVFREIKSSPEAPALVALHGAAEPEMILSAMRAGASEYLYPPLQASVRPALERIATERAQQARGSSAGGKTLAFFSAKGGCGATTIACHVGVELQRQTSQNILLADFDMEAGMIRLFMKARSEYSVLDAVNNIDRLDQSFWRALISNGMPRLEILSAPPMTGSMEMPREEGFRHVVRFARAQYDWVLVDLGRSLTLRSMSVLEDIDECYLVTTLDVPALYQSKQILRTLLESGYGRNRLRVVLNRMPKRPEVTLDEVQKMLGLPVFAVLPNDYIRLYEAYAEGGLLPPNGELAASFARLAAQIAGLPERKKKSRLSLFA
ncbi:MAG: AAA family ATPase [Acidobacteriota bacterium]